MHTQHTRHISSAQAPLQKDQRRNRTPLERYWLSVQLGKANPQGLSINPGQITCIHTIVLCISVCLKKRRTWTFCGSGATNPGCTSICSTTVVAILLPTSWFHCSSANSGMDNTGHEGAAVLFFTAMLAPWIPGTLLHAGRGEEWNFPAGHGRADGDWACVCSEQLRVWTSKHTNTHENHNGPHGDHQQKEHLVIIHDNLLLTFSFCPWVVDKSWALFTKPGSS